MFVIRPETQNQWKSILHAGYGVEEQRADTLVDAIAGDPRVSLPRPQDEQELREVVESLEDVIDGTVDFADISGAEDHATVRDELVEVLRSDLNLHGEQISPKSSQSPQLGAELAVAHQRPDADEQPPDNLEPIIDRFVEAIESDELNRSDLDEIVKWVDYRTTD